MTKTEHLQRIRAKCVWELENTSCAGRAEAGWTATVKVIDLCDSVMKSPLLAELYGAIRTVQDTIIAAWPEELI